MSLARKPSEDKYLARLKDGWQFRVPPWLPGGGITRFFGDARHGSPDLALQAARAARDRQFERAGMSMDPVGKRQFGRSVTVLPGVVLVRNGRFQPGNDRGLYWAAHWNDATGQRRKLYSVRDLGFMQAWESAVADRLERVPHRYSEAELLQARAEALQLWAKHLRGELWAR